PANGGLPYDVLESLIDSIPARNRLVFIDACHSGEVDKEDLVADLKPGSQVVANARSGNIGVKPKAGLKNSQDYMNMLFSDVQRGSGASVISAAGGMEFALESKDWNNGVFTYSIINGLKNNAADYNKNGQVNLSELKQYIGKKVVELTNGKQNPTMRKENAGTDFVIFGK
ncbi:MAG: repeat protein, partial [Bacteroidetes bacterium]|nr:repeat protein [Bacteroidota bacterium]